MTGLIARVSGGVGPHRGGPIVVGGAPLTGAAGALVVLHGRGGRAADLMEVAGEVAGPGFALLGPEALHNSWYPHRFIEPNHVNEPYLSSALSVADDLIERLLGHGVPARRIVLLGFSQGACLALECAGRSTVPLGAVVGFSGGLIGATLDTSRYHRHDGMGVFLACAEQDPHIPIERVRSSAVLLRSLGADILTRLRQGCEHGIRQSDINDAAQMIAAREGSPYAVSA